MTRVTEPPTQHRMVDENGLVTMQWLLYFNKDFIGDTGTPWTPTFVSLSNTGGAPTITGMTYKLSDKLAYFRVTITPVVDTSAVAGTTYIDNFPLVIRSDGQCLASAGVIGSTDAGAIVAGTGRIYVPAWTTVAVPVTITGFVEIR